MSTAIAIDNETAGLGHAWHPVARLEDLVDGPQRVDLLGAGYVVVRYPDGSITAYADRCPHRSARLSDGSLHGTTLVCPYHGWEFGHGGQCSLIPALGAGATLPTRASLTAVATAQRYGLVWLAPAEPRHPLPVVAEWDDPTLRRVWLPVVDIRAGAAQFVDNFLDFAHFPFVHAGTFGNDEEPHIDDFTVERHGATAVVNYQHTITNHEDPLVASGEHPLVQPRRMRYEFTAPFSCLLRLDLPLTAMVNAIYVVCQPVAVGVTRLYTVMLRNDCPTDDAAQAAIDYELSVLAEDLKIIEVLPDTTLSLEPTAQLHTRADRLTVEFRRILRDLLTTA